MITDITHEDWKISAWPLGLENSGMGLEVSESNGDFISVDLNKEQLHLLRSAVEEALGTDKHPEGVHFVGMLHEGIVFDVNHDHGLAVVDITHEGANIERWNQSTGRWQKDGHASPNELRALAQVFRKAADKAEQLVAEEAAKPKHDYLVFVPSFTQQGVVYTLGIKIGVVWHNVIPVSCDCPDYVNRSAKNSNHTCKHMDFVEQHPDAFRS